MKHARESILIEIIGYYDENAFLSRSVIVYAYHPHGSEGADKDVREICVQFQGIDDIQRRDSDILVFGVFGYKDYFSNGILWLGFLKFILNKCFYT